MLGRSGRVPSAILTATGTGGSFTRWRRHKHQKKDSSIASTEYPGQASKRTEQGEKKRKGKKETASHTPGRVTLDDVSGKAQRGDRPYRHGKTRVFHPSPMLSSPLLSSRDRKKSQHTKEEKKRMTGKGSQKGATEHYYDVHARKARIVDWGEETLPAW